MKTLLLCLCLATQACAVRVYYPNGRIAFADYTDFEGSTEIETKNFKFKRTGKQNASTPTRVAISEIGNTGLKLGLGAAGVVVK